MPFPVRAADDRRRSPRACRRHTSRRRRPRWLRASRWAPARGTQPVSSGPGAAEQGWLGGVVVMKISISRKVVCSRAGGAQGLWGSCPTSWNPREASQQRILGPRPQAAWGGGGGRGPVGQGGAREPRGQPEAASRVQHGQQTPCRATTAVDRAICCSQVAGALESRVCVGIGGFPSQRIGSKVRGVARLSHGVLHCSHGAASELHPARHQPRAPAPHIL